MNKRLNILCFVESDIVIRHFIDSGVLSSLTANHDLTMVFPPENWKRINCDQERLNWPYPLVRISIPDKRRMIWGTLFALDSLKIRFGYGWWRLWKNRVAIVGWRRGIKGSIATLPGLNQISIGRLRKQLEEIPPDKLREYLENNKFELILHPSTFDGYFINDIITEGKKLKIPTVLLMNSWDNPSIKRSVMEKPDFVGVWGEQTKHHAAHFMSIDPSRIWVTGAAQFDVYRVDPSISKQELREEHQIPEGYKVLLFATSSKGSNDFLHLNWLDKAIEENQLGKWKVIYRPHPYGIAASQARAILAADWSNVIVEASMVDFMKRLAEDRHQGLYMAKYQRTHDLLSHVDAVVSPLSTIIIEAAVHGLPVMCFSPAEEPGSKTWRANKRLMHFDEIKKSPLVVYATKYAEFLPGIRELFEKADNPNFSNQIRIFSNQFVEFWPDSYSAAVNELIEYAAAETFGKA